MKVKSDIAQSKPASASCVLVENRRREQAGIGDYMLISGDRCVLFEATLEEIEIFLATDIGRKQQLPTDKSRLN